MSTLCTPFLPSAFCDSPAISLICFLISRVQAPYLKADSPRRENPPASRHRIRIVRERHGQMEEWTWDASLVECEPVSLTCVLQCLALVPVLWQLGHCSGMAGHMKVTSWSFIDMASKVQPCAQTLPGVHTRGFPLFPLFHH